MTPRNAQAEQHSDGSGGKNAGTGSGQDGFGMGTIAWTTVTHLALTSSQPGHTGVSPCSPVRKRHDGPTRTPDAPLSSELWHCTAYPDFRPEATWAQPFGPGRAVLTRGVSRRSGSVAYVRADASPTEVLARSSLHPQPAVRQTFTWFLFRVADRLVTEISWRHTHP
jgi:hypothetical protein